MQPRGFDLIVIGSGPAGEKGAAQVAYFGKKVAIVERAAQPGGATANTGTLPSKTLRETALALSGWRQRHLWGVEFRLKEDVTVVDLLRRAGAVSDAERERVRTNIDRHGIELIRGQATFLDPHTIAVRHGDEVVDLLQAPAILIATGSTPIRPADVPFDGRTVLDSDDLLKLDFLPKRLAVLGAGVIGCEYASVFAALDVEVTLVDKRSELLGFLDRDVAVSLRARMERLGVQFRLGVGIRSVSVRDHAARIELEDGSVIEEDHVLVAAGRRGVVDGLGLENTGVALDPRGNVIVDEHYRTSVRGIWAAGDIVGWPSLASVAMEQARIAMCDAFDIGYKQKLNKVLPIGIYTVPELASAGETEQGAIDRGARVETGMGRFGSNARGIVIGEVEGFVKLVFDADDRTLLGVHVLGEGATELIHVGLTALQQGAKIDLFIDAVYNYPTLTEAYKYAAYDGLGRQARRKAFEAAGA